MEFEINNEKLVAQTGYRINDIRLVMDLVESSISQYKKAWQKIKQMSISIVFISKEEITNLNLEFRNKNEVTDVLSFEVSDQLSEIYICPEYIKERLNKVMKPEKLTRRVLVTEFIRLFIHGVLHVAGYDHEKYLHWEPQYKGNEEMFIVQEKILKDVMDKADIIFN